MSKPKIIIYRNPFDPLDNEVINVSKGTHIVDFLIEKFPDGFKGLDTRIYLNKTRVRTDDFLETLNENDVLEIKILPKGPVQVIIAIVSIVVGYVVATGTKRDIPTIDTPDNLSSIRRPGSSNYNLNIQTNLARIGEAIPSVYGKTKWFPDLAASPYLFFKDNLPVSRHLLCLGHGTFDLQDIKLGNTSILNNENLTYQLYNPNEPMELFNDNVYTIPEIQGANVQSREHTSRTRPVTFDKANRFIETTIVAIEDNPLYENIFSVGETIKVITFDDSVSGEYVIESITPLEENGGNVTVQNRITFENTDDWPDTIDASNNTGLSTVFNILLNSITSFTQYDIGFDRSRVLDIPSTPIISLTGGGSGAEVSFKYEFRKRALAPGYTYKILEINVTKKGVNYAAGDQLKVVVTNLPGYYNETYPYPITLYITLQAEDIDSSTDVLLCRVKEYIENKDYGLLPANIPWNFKHFIEPEYSGSFSAPLDKLGNNYIDLDFEFSQGYFKEIIPEGESYGDITDITTDYYLFFWFLDPLTSLVKDMYVKYGMLPDNSTTPNGFTMSNVETPPSFTSGTLSYVFTINTSQYLSTTPWFNQEVLDNDVEVYDTFKTGADIKLYIDVSGTWINITSYITDIDYNIGQITVDENIPYDTTDSVTKIVTGIVLKKQASYIVNKDIIKSSKSYSRLTIRNNINASSNSPDEWSISEDGIYYTHCMSYESGLTLKGYNVQDPFRDFNAVDERSYYDKGYIARIKHIKDPVINYPPVSLLALELIADKSLSFDVDNVYNIVATRKLSKWDGSNFTNPEPTRSIAWALADIWMASYGASRSYTEIDLNGLLELDEEWETRGDTFDGVFDSFVAIWESLNKVSRVGRARPYFDGSSLTIVRDSIKDTYTTLFTSRNMVKNSFKVAYTLDNNESPDGVIIKYLDEDSNYEPAEVSSRPNITRPLEVDFFGCVNYNQAWRESQYLDKQMKLQKYKIMFEVEMLGNIPTYGDKIKVQHDMPSWGQSGRVVAKDGLNIKSNEPFIFEGEAPFYISFATPKGTLSGPHTVTQGVDEYTVVLDVDVTDFEFITELTDRIPTTYTFGPSSNWSQDCTVLSVKPGKNNEKFTIEAVPYFEAIHTADEGEPPLKTDVNITTEIIPPSVSGLVLNNIAGSGVVNVIWNPVFDIDNYYVQKSFDNNTWINVDTPTIPSININHIGALYVRVASQKSGFLSKYQSQSIIAT